MDFNSHWSTADKFAVVLITNPFTVLALTFGIGFVIGLLVGRRWVRNRPLTLRVREYRE